MNEAGVNQTSAPRSWFAPRALWVWRVSPFVLPSLTAAEIATIPGVRAATPMGQTFDRSDSGFGTRLIDGINYDEYSSLTGLRIREGTPLTGGDEAIIDPDWQQNRRAAWVRTVQAFRTAFQDCRSLRTAGWRPHQDSA